MDNGLTQQGCAVLDKSFCHDSYVSGKEERIFCEEDPCGCLCHPLRQNAGVFTDDFDTKGVLQLGPADSLDTNATMKVKGS